MTPHAHAVRITLSPSRFICGAIFIVWALSLVAIELSALPRWVMVFTLPWVAMYWWQARRHFPIALVFHTDGRVSALDANNQASALQAISWRERGPIGVISLRSNRQTLPLPWAVDSLSGEARRALRLWFSAHVDTLRHSGASGSSSTHTSDF